MCGAREVALDKHTGRSLLWAKWIPGVGHLAVPLAGAARVPRGRFHFYNAAGSVAWLALLLAGGYLSMRTIDWLGLFVITAQWAVGAALVVSVVLAVRSYWQRRKFLQTLRMARISPEELYRQVAAGEAAGDRRSAASAGFSGSAAHPAEGIADDSRPRLARVGRNWRAIARLWSIAPVRMRRPR